MKVNLPLSFSVCAFTVEKNLTLLIIVSLQKIHFFSFYISWSDMKRKIEKSFLNFDGRMKRTSIWEVEKKWGEIWGGVKKGSRGNQTSFFILFSFLPLIFNEKIGPNTLF